YNSKKSIRIPDTRLFNSLFIPTDLRPFFTILPEVSQPSSPVPATASNQQQNSHQAQDTSGIIIVNNVTNSSINLANTCTAINSFVFANNAFDHYPELLTEMSLRMPYQLKKLIVFLNAQQQQLQTKSGDAKIKDSTVDAESSSSPSQPLKPIVSIDFNSSWIETLCEYMMFPTVTPYIRKQVRKLLSNLCGSKERYRQVRDYYAIKTNLRAVRRIIVMHFFDHSSSSNSSSNQMKIKLQDLGITEEDLDDEEQLDELIRIIITTVIQNGDDKTNIMMTSDQHRLLNLPYSQLINLVEYLKACLDIAST
ncbi:hypothetical protein BLA29_008674, partial [Euroglyphus maynei]